MMSRKIVARAEVIMPTTNPCITLKIILKTTYVKIEMMVYYNSNKLHIVPPASLTN